MQPCRKDTLPSILSGKNLTFSDWADWFLERRSNRPIAQRETHEQNMNAVKLLRPVSFGAQRLADITPEAVENYIQNRFAEGKRVRLKFGLIRRGKIKPATVHQEFRVLRHLLNVAIRQRKLVINPCSMVEFPVSIKKSTRKPHYMSSSEQACIELVAPNHLKHIIVIMTEIGLPASKGTVADA